MENIPPRPLAIIKVGETFDAMRERRGDFEHWMAAGLGDTRLPVLVLDPRRGDTLPSPTEISGAIVTGSHAMASHREPWSEATGAWLAQLVAHATPVLGICFGHQLLADALGGEAGDHPQGMEIGTVDVELRPGPPTMPSWAACRRRAHVVHRQSALRLPKARSPGGRHLTDQAFGSATRPGPAVPSNSTPMSCAAMSTQARTCAARASIRRRCAAGGPDRARGRLLGRLPASPGARRPARRRLARFGRARTL
jgi:GMP synthase (glutamine-hydrolysing)